MLTGRAHTPEFMDDPAIGRDELREHLRFIRMVNRHLGGTSAALRHFRRWSRSWPRSWAAASTHPVGKENVPIRILDVGTGSADIPLAIARWARQAGFEVRITAVDLHPLTVELAREHVSSTWRDVSSHSGGAAPGAPEPPIQVIQLDAMKLMDQFKPGSFDYAHAGMFLHHLDDIEVVTMLRMMDRLTTRGVIWNDLTRDIVSRVGVRLLAMTSPPKLRHDAIVSVAKGFTRREAIDLASRAGLPKLQFQRHLFGRFTLTSQK
jgi:ubiquinone/menaquinone biosynthesis C-methylase UbiE